MNIQLFPSADRSDEEVRLPATYQRYVRWVPQIGDIFPDFTALTTSGRLRFFDWAEGSWTVLFSHPCAFTPICSTEMAAFAEASEEFEHRNTKLLAFTNSSLLTLGAWRHEVENLFGVTIDFPSVSDTEGQLSSLFGMVHPRHCELPMRRTMVLDPSMRIRMTMDYPVYAGRSTEELLRMIDAMQAQDRFQVQTPADWEKGDLFIVPQSFTDEDCVARFGTTPTRLTPYLRVISPSGQMKAPNP